MARLTEQEQQDVIRFIEAGNHQTSGNKAFYREEPGLFCSQEKHLQSRHR